MGDLDYHHDMMESNPLTHAIIHNGYYSQPQLVRLSSLRQNSEDDLFGKTVLNIGKMRELGVMESSPSEDELLKSRNPIFHIIFRAVNQNRDEFRYSTQFDVRRLLNSNGITLSNNEITLGVNNCNIPGCDSPDYDIDNVRTDRPVVKIAVLPGSILSNDELDYLRTAVAHQFDSRHHRNVSKVCNKLYKSIGPWVRESYNPKSLFRNFRTWLQGVHSTMMFTQLQGFYDKSSPYLPEVPVYFMAHALLVNNCTIDKMLKLRMILSDIPVDQSLPVHMQSGQFFSPDKLMAILRDCLMAFTSCPKEGYYQDDELLGTDAEDQAPLGFFIGDTFHQKGDCEDKLQQGLLMKNALVSCGQQGPDFIRGKIQEHQLNTESGEPLIAGLEQTFVPEFNGSLLQLITDITCCVGNLFALNIFEFHMCVGEVCFGKKFDESNVNSKDLDGHSFGVLEFSPALCRATQRFPILAAMERKIYIVEATGWMNKYNGRNYKKKLRKFAVSNPDLFPMLEKLTEKRKRIRSCMTQDEIDGSYACIYTMGDKTIWKRNPRTGRWQYGARPIDIQRQDPDDLQVVPVRDLLRHFSRKNRSLNTEKFNEERNETSDNTMFDLFGEVEDKLANVKVNYSMPPNPGVLQKMRLQRWQPILSSHFTELPRSSSFVFSVHNKAVARASSCLRSNTHRYNMMHANVFMSNF